MADPYNQKRPVSTSSEQWPTAGDDSMYDDLKNSLDCLRQVVSEEFV